MSRNCLSSKLSCRENFIGKQKEENQDQNLKSSFSSIREPVLYLRHQWQTRMLSPHLYFMGQALSKKFTKTEGFYARKVWKVLNHPWVARSVILLVVLFYVGIPIWFCFCPWLRRGAVYLHFADWPFQNLSSPESYGLHMTSHFFVEASPGVLLGTWYIPPSHSQQLYHLPHLSSLIDDDRPVVLYLHGSAESRSAAYRRSMYRVLSSEPVNAHVITFDYRGFGDSSYVSPTVQTLEQDAIAMFNWLEQKVPASRIILWGHSLGTGIAIRLGEYLASKNDSSPLAIVLEAPFTSVADATHTFPLSFFHRRLPFFQKLCSDQTRHPDTDMNNEDRVSKITAPLLVLHAADDGMVWSEQGKKIWRKAVESRGPDLHVPVFVELDGMYGCGHRNIHRAPNLPQEIYKFLASVKNHHKTLEACKVT